MVAGYNKNMEILPPDEEITVRRHSSIDQYKGFLSIYHKGGYTPIQFDMIDGITCNKIHHHPIIISYGDDIGYHYQDAECTYASDDYILFDKKTTELVTLPCANGGQGEFYERHIDGHTFVNFDNDTSFGTHNEKRLRIGTDYLLADEKLPAVD